MLLSYGKRRRSRLVRRRRVRGAYNASTPCTRFSKELYFALEKMGNYGTPGRIAAQVSVMFLVLRISAQLRHYRFCIHTDSS